MKRNEFKRFLKRNKITQAAFARKVGLPEATVSKWASEDRRPRPLAVERCLVHFPDFPFHNA